MRSMLDPKFLDRLVAENFKFSLIRDTLRSARVAIQRASLEQFASSRPNYVREDRVFYYDIDHLEYQGTIYKNLRNQGKLEWFELHLSNDGFVYKDADDEDFKHGGFVPQMSRGLSRAWVYLPNSEQDLLDEEINALALMFGFTAAAKLDWFYNSDVMRMDCRIAENARILEVSFEPGFPRYDNSDKALNLTYSQIRDKNQRSSK